MREEYTGFIRRRIYLLASGGRLYKVGQEQHSRLYLKKAMTEHKQLTKLIGEIKIEVRKPQQNVVPFPIQL